MSAFLIAVKLLSTSLVLSVAVYGVAGIVVGDVVVGDVVAGDVVAGIVVAGVAASIAVFIVCVDVCVRAALGECLDSDGDGVVDTFFDRVVGALVGIGVTWAIGDGGGVGGIGVGDVASVDFGGDVDVCVGDDGSGISGDGDNVAVIVGDVAVEDADIAVEDVDIGVDSVTDFDIAGVDVVMLSCWSATTAIFASGVSRSSICVSASVPATLVSCFPFLFGKFFNSSTPAIPSPTEPSTRSVTSASASASLTSAFVSLMSPPSLSSATYPPISSARFIFSFLGSPSSSSERTSSPCSWLASSSSPGATYLSPISLRYCRNCP